MSTTELAERVDTNAAEIAGYWARYLEAGVTSFLVAFDDQPVDASDEVVADYRRRRVVTAAATLYAAEALAATRGITVGIRPTLNGFIVARLETGA